MFSCSILPSSFFNSRILSLALSETVIISLYLYALVGHFFSFKLLGEEKDSGKDTN
jgi:hypothetical protein